MLTEILLALRENKVKTGVIFFLIYVICFGWDAAAYVAIAEVFTFVYFVIITSGDDDDDWWNDWHRKDLQLA